MLTLGFSRGRLPRCYYVTAPVNYYNRFTGQEAWADPIALAAGTTIGGVFAGGNAPVVATATLAVTAALHAGKTILLSASGGFTSSLPAATGTGSLYRFVVGTVSTTGYLIATVPTTDIFKGQIIAASTAETPDLAQPWVTSTNSNLITLNGTTSGGVSVGDYVEVRDIAAGVWQLIGFVTASGSEITPLSHV